MLSRKARLCAVTASAAVMGVAATLGAAGTAWATNSTPCNANDLLKIHYQGGSACFANRGFLDLNSRPLRRPSYLSAGNNIGSITVDRPSRTGFAATISFKRYEQKIISGDWLVIGINIE